MVIHATLITHYIDLPVVFATGKAMDLPRFSKTEGPEGNVVGACWARPSSCPLRRKSQARLLKIALLT